MWGDDQMIYFARFDTGSIKIGFSKKPLLRSHELRYAFGTKVEILATEEGDRSREKELHERFADLRIGRMEQFRPGPDLIAYIGADLSYATDYQSVQAQPLNPENGIPVGFRLNDERLAKVDALGKLWSPRSPLNRTAVINVLIDQQYEQEMTWKSNAKAAGKPARAAGEG